eukprot:s777_g2.t2
MSIVVREKARYSTAELSLDGELLEADALALLPRRCPRLQSLTISFAAELDGPALACLGQLHYLQALTLKKAQKPVDDEWAGFFSKRSADWPLYSEGWRVLNFCECELLCDGAVQTLAATPQPRLLEPGTTARALFSPSPALYSDGPAEQFMAGDRPELRLIRAGLQSLADAGLRAPEASRLRALHLHGNALVSLQGLDAVCPALEELVASSNDLRKLQGLAGLQRLRLLDVSCNCLRSLEGLEGLRLLEELRAAYNQISSLQALLPLRGSGSKLRFLDLRDNAIEHLGELLFLGGLHNLQDLRLQGAGGRRRYHLVQHALGEYIKV